MRVAVLALFVIVQREVVVALGVEIAPLLLAGVVRVVPGPRLVTCEAGQPPAPPIVGRGLLQDHDTGNLRSVAVPGQLPPAAVHQRVAVFVDGDVVEVGVLLPAVLVDVDDVHVVAVAGILIPGAVLDARHAAVLVEAVLHQQVGQHIAGSPVGRIVRERLPRRSRSILDVLQVLLGHLNLGDEVFQIFVLQARFGKRIRHRSVRRIGLAHGFGKARRNALSARGLDRIHR